MSRTVCSPAAELRSAPMRSSCSCTASGKARVVGGGLLVVL